MTRQTTMLSIREWPRPAENSGADRYAGDCHAATQNERHARLTVHLPLTSRLRFFPRQYNQTIIFLLL